MPVQLEFICDSCHILTRQVNGYNTYFLLPLPLKSCIQLTVKFVLQDE